MVASETNFKYFIIDLMALRNKIKFKIFFLSVLEFCPKFSIIFVL